MRIIVSVREEPECTGNCGQCGYCMIEESAAADAEADDEIGVRFTPGHRRGCDCGDCEARAF